MPLGALSKIYYVSVPFSVADPFQLAICHKRSILILADLYLDWTLFMYLETPASFSYQNGCPVYTIYTASQVLYDLWCLFWFTCMSAHG